METAALSSIDSFWQTFYSAQPGFEFFNDQSFATAEHPPNAEHKTIAPLHDMGLIIVEGPDAGTFLQGQLSADVLALESGQATLAAHCDAKGRMHANFILHCISPEQYFIQLPASNAETACKALNKYAVFSKVDVANASAKYACFGLSLSAHPLINDGRIAGFAKHINCDDKLLTLWLVREKTDVLLGLLDELAIVWAGSADWHRAAIEAGIGFIEADTSGEFIPQMLNMDSLEGISFTKGCYTGQEIIARMKYRGAVKRRCYPFTAQLSHFNLNEPVRIDSVQDLASQIKPGSPLLTAEGSTAGTVISTVVNSIGDVTGLAVIKSTLIDANHSFHLTLTAVDASHKISVPATLNAPPYAINNN